MSKTDRLTLDMKYARIIELLSVKVGISYGDAMNMFYNSPLFDLIDKGIAELYCRSDLYLAEEIIRMDKLSNKS
ncbi:DUF3791 domain-containing protein [Palleniella intestinalis]|jgi:hypothetical protein|uniref:DUF3791 domain-containing protein n=1 Tax=Palleniella intestinalis TaxID=2736291 RepID=UPI0020A6C869|nr:DUF3791 domain-containing protein [Palleniella intestinalis]